MVSGLFYTPIGDPKPFHASLAHTKDQLQKHPPKFPLPITGQDEGWMIKNPGKITRIKQLWFNIDGKEVPVYYVLGFIENETIIGEILDSAFRKNPEDYSSWCSQFDFVDYTELVWDPIERKKKWVTTSGRWNTFQGGIVCCTPCLHYSHLFLPYMGARANNTLIKKHWKTHGYYSKSDVPDSVNKNFKQIGMDQERFDNLFGMYKFKKDKLINFKDHRKYLTP